VTLTDAGPLIALIDAGESDHERCRAALERLQLPMRTTWPAFTEAIYLLGRAAGWPGQDALWRLINREALTLAPLDPELTTRSAELMREYKDHPMDLADATLVAIAEAEHHDKIFTLDSHFRTYRLRDGRHLKLVPD
jgi:predicted nucleic acid-binding protein